MKALYFGYSTGGGHFLHGLKGSRAYFTVENDAPGFPWSPDLLDTGLLTNGKHEDVYDGRVFWTCGGNPLWLAFFWWDRSGDKRSNSNSGFYVQGFPVTELQAAFDYACAVFPDVVSRQKYPLVIQA